MSEVLAATSPHTIEVPRFSTHEKDIKASPINPVDVAQTWTTKLNGVFDSEDASKLAALFHQDCWWRDQLALSWDFRTLRGLTTVIDYVKGKLPRAHLRNIKIRTKGAFAPSTRQSLEGLEWVQSMFDFETEMGSGSGVFRLVQGADGEWKAYAISTMLQQLTDHKEQTGHLRPPGGNNSLLGGSVKGNWSDRRHRQAEFLDEEPVVLVIGAGQAGLNIAARLQQLNLPTLIVEKNARIGDNWRHRYRTLVTHDPVHYTHMAYLPFPSNWPMFTPKDKLGDWFEAYASLMELNAWTSTKVCSAEYHEKQKVWTVEVERADGSKRKLSPRHIVFCTGHAGEPLVPNFPGQGSFKGEVYHGSQHQDASFSGDLQGKKVVVVGTGNSGHDIAQNFYENGADVTMLQRRGTYVITAKTGLFMLHKGMYDEDSPPTEDVDIVAQSLPIPVQFALNTSLTKRITEAEKETLDGLTKAGFALDFGRDGSGIFRKYMTRGGGYYIDVGCSQLIIDGKIKVVQSPGGIAGFTEHAIQLADGSVLPADIVVLATGYDNMRTSVRKILGDKVADRCHDVWDLNEEGELNAIWRSSGHPRFWYMGGNLALCRIYSKLLALQIKAAEEGLLE